LGLKLKEMIDKAKEFEELIQLEDDLTHMFDSDVRVGLALLEKIRELKKYIKENEKNTNN
jgi:hypothetical protein